VRPRAGLEVVYTGLHSVLAFARIDRASFSGRKRRGRTFVVLPSGIPSFCQRYCSTFESKKVLRFWEWIFQCVQVCQELCVVFPHWRYFLRFLPWTL